MADDPDKQNDSEPEENGDGDERWYRQRRWQAAIAGGVIAILAVAGVLAYNHFKRPGDVSCEGDECKIVEEGELPEVVDQTINWPVYGFNRAHTRYLPAPRVHPPYERIWKFGLPKRRDGGDPLLEFPPIVVNDRLYLVDNDGRAFAINAKNGKVVWMRQIAELNASSPAYSRGRLFITNLEPGQIQALDPRTGKVIWKRELPGRAESSPIVLGDKVIFGCENGELFAVSWRNGKTIWTSQLAGPIKASPAFRDGILYVGDYGGAMSAVHASNGELEWQTGGLGTSFGRTGEFYSTPAVAFGRVYAGNNEGRVYSFNAESGELVWSYSTNGYAYSSPTAADTKHTDPTIYIGSFGGTLYALDAASGEERWVQDPGGQVIGSTLGIGEVVYVQEFSDTSTTGYRMRDGKKVFEFHSGAYHVGVSDGEIFYLTGYGSIHALKPVKKKRGRGGNGASGGPGSQRR
jgi:outer membrane protein assembly factor BamB